MIGLTKKQQEILSFIQDFIHRYQYSPSYREIMQHFGFASLGTVSKHVDALKRKGVITGERQSSRSIHPVQMENCQKNSFEIELPFLGHLSAGLPIETFSQTQNLAVPEFLVSSSDRTYVLRARGNTLAEEMISDGDLILIEARSEAFAGELVVAFLSHDRGSTLVKRYFPEGNYIKLEGGASRLESLTVRPEDLQIQGVVVGLIRLFEADRKPKNLH